MVINCFQISKDLQLTACDYERAVKTIQEGDACIWIDIQGPETAELEVNLEKLQVTGLARRLCLEARDRPGFYPMSNLTFVVVPVLAVAKDFHGVEHVAFLTRRNLMLTIRNLRAIGLQDIIIQEESAEWLPDVSVAGLVSSFMIVLSLESLKRSAVLRDSIMDLEKRMDAQPDTVEMKEISHKRSELLTLESVVSGQVPVLHGLMAMKRVVIGPESVREYLNSALANLQATDRSLDWLEGRIDVMRSLVDSLAQEKTNRRLGRLTIVSMIFLPITFLAGLWGMNFEHMPGLTHPFGYPLALGFMFIISLTTYFYFRWKKWLD